MKEFKLKSGTIITIENNIVSILRTDSKSAVKGLFAGRVTGKMTIRLSAITGLIYSADYLIICASGLPTPIEFKLSKVNDIKQYPNCVTGKPEELEELYNYIISLI